MHQREKLTFEITDEGRDQIIPLDIPDGHMINDFDMKGLNPKYQFRVQDNQLIIRKTDNFHYKDLTGDTASFGYTIIPEQKSLINIPDYMKNIEINTNMTTSVKNMYNYEYLEGTMRFNEPYHRDYIWTSEQQVGYIMGLFRGKADIRPIIIEEYDNDGNRIFEVLDGKQRLLTIFRFIENKFSVRDLFFKDLCEEDRKYILNFTIKYTRITPMNSFGFINKLFKLNMYIQINYLGTKLNEYDIRKIGHLIFN